MNELKIKINWTILLCALIAILLFIRDVVDIEINKYLFLIIISVIMIFLKRDNYIKFLFFLIPLLSGLPGNYIIPISLLIYIFKTKKLNKYQIFFSIFVIVNEMISYLLYDIVYSDIGEIVAGFSYIPLFFILLYDDSSNKRENVQYFLIGVAVLCSILLLTNLTVTNGNLIELFAAGKYRIGNKVVEEVEGNYLRLRMNANTLAYFCLSSICICLTLFKNKAIINKTISIALIALFSITGVLTLSRTFFICYVIMISLFILFSMNSIKNILKNFLLLFVIIVSISFIFENNSFLKQGIVSRFELENVSTAGGRTVILNNYIKSFNSSPKAMILGTGSTKISNKLQLQNSIHNGFFQVIICYGIPGSLVFFYGIFYSLKNKSKIKIDKTKWIPLIITIMFVQTIQFINPYMLLFPYVVSKYIISNEF